MTTDIVVKNTNYTYKELSSLYINLVFQNIVNNQS